MEFNVIQFLMNPKKWWIPITIILAVSITGVSIIGYETYYKAPPIPDYVTENGDSVFTHDEILRGQSVFLKYALMEYGSMFGDGANRGPDFTAQALHQVAFHMQQYYANQPGISKMEWMGVNAQVQHEIKENNYSGENNQVKLSAAQVYACDQLTQYYRDVFKGIGNDSFAPVNYIKNDAEIRQLSAFFFWGSWVCGVERPGKARIGNSFKNTKPINHGERNNKPTLASCWSRVSLFRTSFFFLDAPP